MYGTGFMLKIFLAVSAFLGLFHREYLKPSATNETYLKQHIIAQGPVDQLTRIELPAELRDRRLILLTEAHGSLAPQWMDLSLLEALNRQAGVTYYAAEIDPTEADAFNTFLNTGDESGMRAVFDLWTPKEQWGNRDFENKIRAIRAYNQTVPAEQQVRFLGLDEVQYFPFAVRWMAKATGAQVEEAWLHALANRPRKDAAAVVLQWNGNRRSLNPADQNTLDAVLFTLRQNAEAVPHRDTVIFKNYAFQVEHGVLGSRQAYGMWGMFHGLQAGARGILPFAAQVRRSDLPAAESIATILSIGVDSSMMIPASELPGLMRPEKQLSITMPSGADGPLIYAKGISDFKQAAPGAGQITLFQLDAPDSPYATSLIFGPHWTMLEAMPFDKPLLHTTAYVQYVAFYRNSRAVYQRKTGE